MPNSTMGRLLMSTALGIYFMALGFFIFLVGDGTSDKLLMNYAIMSLYIGTTAWWLSRGSYWDSGYWIAAFLITFVVTFGKFHR